MPLIIVDTLLLLLSHVGTALLQSDAIRWEARLTDAVAYAGMDDSLWSLVVLLFLALTVIRAIGTVEEKAQWKEILGSLRHHLGNRFWWLILLALVPQRLMDTNSGYTCIQPEQTSALLLLGLDWARTFASLIWFRRCVMSCRPADAAASQQSSPDLPLLSRSRLLGFAVLILSCGVVGQQLLLGGIPRVQDEIIQHWQARLLLLGRAHTPPLPIRESFLPDPSIDENGSWIYSTYQPAYAFLKAALMKVNLDTLLNPMLGVLCLLLFVRLFRTAQARETEIYGISLFACSPFLLLMSASQMNHSLGLLCLLIGVNGLADLTQGRNRGLAGAMVAIALLLLTRRVEGAALMLSLFISAFLIPATFARRAIWGGLLLGSVIPAVLAQSQWAQLIAGDPLLAVRHVQVSASVLAQLSPGLLWSNNIDNLLGFSAWAFGGGLAGWTGFALLKRREAVSNTETIIDLFFVLHSILVIVGYSWYYFQDFCYGPRYLFPLLPAAAWGGARVLRLLDQLWPNAGRRAQGLIAAIGLFVMVHAWWSLLARDYWHIRSDLASVIERLVPNQSLVFLRHPARIRLDVLRQLRALRVSAPLMQRAVSTDAVDYDALLDQLRRLPQDAPEGLVAAVLDEAEQQARYRRPEEFSINGMEVVRLNHPFLGTGSRILALDLGDGPNALLKQAFSEYQPVLLYRRGDEYGIASEGPCGLARFDEPRGLPSPQAEDRR